MTTRPLLLLDVDGPLNPFAAKPTRRPEGYVTHRMMPASWVARFPSAAYAKPLRVWLNPGHGPALLALPFDLAWCTTWRGEANEWIGPHVGLPELPFVDWSEEEMDSRPGHGCFWKTERVVEYAAGRPFAWVDDEVTDHDREFVAAHHAGPALLHAVSPRVGLTDGDFDTLTAWAGSLTAA
jgi:hypothetical protein